MQEQTAASNYYCYYIITFYFCYNALSQKARFQSVPNAALYLYNIQRENMVFKNSLCITLSHFKLNNN